MFGFSLFVVLFVALCLFTADREPDQVAAPVEMEYEALSVGELLAEAEALIAQPLPPRTAALVAQAAAIAAPVAVSVVKVKVPAYHSMTSVQLRKECQRRGIGWRNAHGQGKHLLKGEMVAALA